MKIVRKDKNLAEREKILAERKLIEDTKAKDYLESLKGNKNFQRYVIEGIIKKQLDFLIDIRNIKSGDFKDLEEVGRLVFQAQAARKILEKILSDILN